MIDKLCNQNLPSNQKYVVKNEKNNKNGNSSHPNDNNNNTNGVGGHKLGHQTSNGTSHQQATTINPMSKLSYPPGPNKQLGPQELNPPTPSIFVQNEAEVFSPQLQEFCLAHPIAVIRNISRVLKLNLGLFSTKTLVELDATHSIEIRTQLEQPSDQNWDSEKKHQIWRCESPRNFSKIGKYALYQARSFQNHLNKADNEEEIFNIFENSTTLKRNSQNKFVTFGTNVDLSDTKKWKAQLDELDKLPMFSRVVSASNMLSHVGHPILGMNTVQLYMKVPGCRTPGHQENNNFCSVNINIGPGDCEWFGVPEEYWGPMAKLCADNGTNFVKDSWWPNLDDLQSYNIPVYRFIQKPGDLVWVNTGTVHWVQAVGWCNNIAWNVGPITTKQFRSAIERYEWNKVERYKSIVPMTHLTWNLARNVEIHDEELYQMIKDFLTTTIQYNERIIRMLEDNNIQIRWHGKAPHEPVHYCARCEIELFTIVFAKAIDKKLFPHCAKCAIAISPIMENFIVLQEYDMSYLNETYSNFIQTFRSDRIKRTKTN